MLLAVDVSNLQPTLTPEHLNALYAAGVRRVIVGMQYPTPEAQQRYGVGPGNAHLNFAALRADGRFKVAGYFESTPPEWAFPQCQEFMPLVDWIGVGVEEGGYEETPTIDGVIAFIRGLAKEPVIYSSRYMLQRLNLLGAQRWHDAGIRFWDALYDGRADGFGIDPPAGPWTSCTVDQYSMHGRIPGLPFEVDLDACDEDAPVVESAGDYSSSIPSEEEEMQVVNLMGNAAIQVQVAIETHQTEIIGRQRGAGLDEITSPAPPPGYRDFKVRLPADLIGA